MCPQWQTSKDNVTFVMFPEMHSKNKILQLSWLCLNEILEFQKWNDAKLAIVKLIQINTYQNVYAFIDIFV